MLPPAAADGVPPAAAVPPYTNDAEKPPATRLPLAGTAVLAGVRAVPGVESAPGVRGARVAGVGASGRLSNSAMALPYMPPMRRGTLPGVAPNTDEPSPDCEGVSGALSPSRLDPAAAPNPDVDAALGALPPARAELPKAVRCT